MTGRGDMSGTTGIGTMNHLMQRFSRLLGRIRPSGPLRWLLLGGAVLGYALLSLWPLDFAPPRVVDNGAAWTEDGTLRFTTPGLAVTDRAPEWLETVRATDHFELEVTARPLLESQRSQRRILTIARNSRDYSFLLGQRGRHLIMRVWRTCGRLEVLELRCENAHMERHVLGTLEPVDIRVAVQPGALDMWVDGEHVYHRTLPEAPLAVWADDHRLAFGSAVTGSLPWLGEVSRAVLRTGGQQVNLLSEATLQRPRSFPIFDREPLLVPFTDLNYRDALNNLVFYAPLGALLALLGLGRRRLALPAALLLVGAVSFGLETAQLFAAGRNPSATDLILNVTGGGLAFAAVRLLLVRPRARRRARSVERQRLASLEQSP